MTRQPMPAPRDSVVYHGDRHDSLDKVEGVIFYALVPLGTLITLCLLIGLIVSAVTS